MAIKSDVILFGAVGLGLYLMYRDITASSPAQAASDAAAAAGSGIASGIESIFGGAGGGGLASNEISPAPGIIVSIPPGTNVDDYMSRAGWHRGGWTGGWVPNNPNILY